MKARSIRGGASLLAGQAGSLVLRIGSTAILARLLLPEQFGLVGMVTAITGFAQIFKDLGLSDATIQQQDLNHEKVSALFWINALVGLLTTVVVACISPIIAWFYKDPRLMDISIALSACFLFGGLCAQHQALLNRQMRFGHLALINLVSVLLGSVAGIFLAWAGFGYWSLVWKEVLTSFFAAAGTWILCGWMPGFPRFRVGIRSMIHFGRDVTGSNAINYFSGSVDKILIGRIHGASSLGLYERATQLMHLPMQQIRFPLTRVAFTALSALQNDPDKYRDYYRKLNELLSFIYMPMVVYLGIFSENIIRLILGEKWTGAAMIFRILAIASFIGPVSSVCDVVLVTCGLTKRYLVWGILNSVFMIFSFALGIHWGAVGVATSYTIGRYILFVPSLWYRFKGTPVSMAGFFQSILLPSVASLLMGLGLILIFQYVTIRNPIAQISISMMIAAILYLGVWWNLPDGRKKVLEYSSYTKLLAK